MNKKTDSERSHEAVCPWCEQRPATKPWPMKQHLCLKCHAMFATWRYTDIDRAWSVIEH
jgi:ribosomal protein L37AE/L43A